MIESGKHLCELVQDRFQATVNVDLAQLENQLWTRANITTSIVPTNGMKIDLGHSAFVNEWISQTEKMMSARKMGISPQMSSWLGHGIPCMGIKGENAPCDRKLQEACSQPSEMTWDSNLLMDQHWESVKHRGEWYTTVYDPMWFPFR